MRRCGGTSLLRGGHCCERQNRPIPGLFGRFRRGQTSWSEAFWCHDPRDDWIRPYKSSRAPGRCKVVAYQGFITSPAGCPSARDSACDSGESRMGWWWLRRPRTRPAREAPATTPGGEVRLLQVSQWLEPAVEQPEWLDAAADAADGKKPGPEPVTPVGYAQECPVHRGWSPVAARWHGEPGRKQG